VFEENEILMKNLEFEIDSYFFAGIYKVEIRNILEKGI
jgi:hypothetical protein